MIGLPTLLKSFSYAAFRLLLLAFLALNLLPSSAPPPPDKRSANPAFAFENDENLQRETDVFLPLFDRMPRVPVFLTDEAIVRGGTNTDGGAAYTQCYPKEFPVIYVKKIYYQKANQKQLANSLKHELTHAWLCRQGLMSVGHGPAFRQKFTEVGGFGN